MKRKSIYFLILGILLFLIVLFLLLTENTLFIDNYGEIIRNIFTNRSFQYVFLFITNIMSVIGIIIILILTIILFRKRNIKKELIVFITSIGVCLLVTNIIKILIGRGRPLETLLDVTGYSFPSAHSSVSMLVYGYLALLINKYYSNKHKYLYIILCGLMVFLTGLSRIYFNVHYITDVIAGFGLGLIILYFSNYVLKRLTK